MGPTMSFRGIDNASYYVLGDDPRYTFDTTGTGNSLNLKNGRVLQMVMDSLRYWVEDCHVDGFRFDLASTLGRDLRRLRPRFGVFGGHAPGSRPEPGQAHRRAPGTRGREATSSATTRPAGPSGTTSTSRRDARVLEGRAGPGARARRQPPGLLAALRAPRPAALGLGQLRHRARRLHPRRHGLLRAEAQRGQRRGQHGRPLAQSQPQLGRRGADRRPRHPRGAPADDAQPAHDAALQPGHAR